MSTSKAPAHSNFSALSPARALALEVLADFWSVPERGKSASQMSFDVVPRKQGTQELAVLLDTAFQRHHISTRDAALCTELVYGVLRAKNRLSALLGRFLSAPDLLPQKLILALLLASYELLFLRVPEYATVHSFVEYSKTWGQSLAKLTNGVLRALCRQSQTLLAEDAQFCATLPQGSALEQRNALMRLGTLPAWLAEQWLAQFDLPKAWALALRTQSQPAPSWRLNSSRPGWKELRSALLAQAAEDTSHGALFQAQGLSGLVATALNRECMHSMALLERQGFATRQGLGSQLLMDFVLAHTLSTGTVWDACCGRGGKTCLMLERGCQVICASDINAQRLQALREHVERLNVPLPVLEMSSALLSPLRSFLPTGLVNHVLLDVPCSGLGTLARNPELRWNLHPDSLPKTLRLQADILHAGWLAVAPGGSLTYATCTTTTAENADQVRAFLTQHQDARLVEQCFLQPEALGHDLMFAAIIHKIRD